MLILSFACCEIRSSVTVDALNCFDLGGFLSVPALLLFVVGFQAVSEEFHCYLKQFQELSAQIFEDVYCVF